MKKGHTVLLNTDLDNAFIVKSKDGRSIRFPVDERGLYVKENVLKYAKEPQQRIPRATRRAKTKYYHLLGYRVMTTTRLS